MKLTPLTRPAQPWFHLLVATPSDATDALWGLERSAPGKAVVRFVRGGKATTGAKFFDEAAAALQFPYYFGENWDACNDCLTDLEWLGAEALVLCVTDAGRLLEKAPADAAKLAAVLQSAAQAWNQPAKGKATRTFHVMLQAGASEAAAVGKRWQALGLALKKLT